MVRGFEPHNHQDCIAHALLAVEERCTARNLRLTAVRRQVLEILLREHVAVGAYQILDDLRLAGFNSQPPVAYRALEFLVTHGFAHKIERLNAFIACAYPGEPHSPVFMICRSCEVVAETCSSPSRSTLGGAARSSGFKIERTIVEVEGLCAACQDGASQ